MNVSAPLMCKKKLMLFFLWKYKTDVKIYTQKRGKERQTFVYLFTGVHCNGGKNWTWNIVITWSEHSIQIESTQLRLRFEKKNYMRFSDFYNTHKNDLISIARFCSVFFSSFFSYTVKMTGQISYGFGCISCSQVIRTNDSVTVKKIHE